MEKERLENQLEILKTSIHKLKGSKDISNKGYNELLSIVADFHRLMEFDCTICYDTGWFGGVGHDETPCPICNGSGQKIHGNNETTDCSTCKGEGVVSNWVNINDKKPPYCEQVLVVRPNKYSGKIDILLGYLHEAEPKGKVYGRIHEEKITYGDYWSFPVVQPLKKVTHWMPLPKPPLNGDSLPKTLQTTPWEGISDSIANPYEFKSRV